MVDALFAVRDINDIQLNQKEMMVILYTSKRIKNLTNIPSLVEKKTPTEDGKNVKRDCVGYCYVCPDRSKHSTCSEIRAYIKVK